MDVHHTHMAEAMFLALWLPVVQGEDGRIHYSRWSNQTVEGENKWQSSFDPDSVVAGIAYVVVVVVDASVDAEEVVVHLSNHSFLPTAIAIEIESCPEVAQHFAGLLGTVKSPHIVEDQYLTVAEGEGHHFGPSLGCVSKLPTVPRRRKLNYRFRMLGYTRR